MKDCYNMLGEIFVPVFIDIIEKMESNWIQKSEYHVYLLEPED